MILVADVSNYQGPDYDFVALAAGGVRGVYIKAYEGNDGPNPYFDEQVEAAHAAGLAVGAYFFCYPLPDADGHANRDPLGQAMLFMQATRNARTLGYLTLPPMADVEWPVESAWMEWGCTGATITAWVQAFAEHVDQLWARQCGIYGGPGFFDTLPQEGVAYLTDRPLWVAEYPVGGPMSAPPASLPPTIRPWARATLWQFTDKFTVPGCSACDGGVFLGTEEEWTAFITAA